MRALRSVPVLLDIARDVEAVAPDAWFVNVTNPLTALCRSVTRETNVKTVGLCNEWVGCDVQPQPRCSTAACPTSIRSSAGVNHFPLATSRCGERRRRVRAAARAAGRPGTRRDEPIWMDPPPAMQWTKVSPAELLVEARRDREQPRAVRDPPPVRRAPRLGRPSLGRVHARLRAPGNDYGTTGACTTTGWRGTAPTPTTTSSTTRRCATRTT